MIGEVGGALIAPFFLLYFIFPRVNNHIKNGKSDAALGDFKCLQLFNIEQTPPNFLRHLFKNNLVWFSVP